MVTGTPASVTSGDSGAPGPGPAGPRGSPSRVSGLPPDALPHVTAARALDRCVSPRGVFAGRTPRLRVSGHYEQGSCEHPCPCLLVDVSTCF